MKQRSPFKILWLLLLPSLFILLSIQMRLASGPFWLGVNSDPAYVYLINSLHIVDGIVPSHIVHPGTPLQLLGAFLINCVSWGQPVILKISSVILYSEFYLALIFVCLMLFCAFSSIAVGIYTFERTDNLVLAALSQTSCLLFLTLPSYGSRHCVLPVVANVTPEALMVGLSNLYAICVLKFSYSAERQENISLAVFWGIICGAGIATKATFFPLLIVPLVLLPNIRNKLTFFLACCLSAVALTLPIISQYGNIFHSYVEMATHKGSYGTGAEGFIGWGLLFQNAKALMVKNVFFSLVLLFASVFVVLERFRFFKRTVADAEEKGKARVLVLLLLICFLQVILVAKDPSSHYLTPAIGLFGLICVFLFERLQKQGAARIVAPLLLCLFVTATSTHASYYSRKLKVTNKTILEFSDQVYTKYPDCNIFSIYRSSSLGFAFVMGDNYGEYYAYSDFLRSKFGHIYHYNQHLSRFYDIGKIIPHEEVDRSSECMLFYSQNYGEMAIKDSRSSKGKKLKILSSIPQEALYSVK